MSNYRRNVFVGITVLVSLVILGWMIIQFGARIGTLFAGEQMAVTFRTDRADGLNPGSAVRHRGVEVGRVESVSLDAQAEQIVIQAKLDTKQILPANLVGEIRIQSFLGSGAAVELVRDGPKPVGILKPGAEIRLRYVGLGILPAEISELADELKLLAIEVRKSDLVGDFKKTVNNLNQQVTTAGQLIDDLRKVTGDEAVQADLRTTITNLRAASDKATVALESFRQFGDDLKGLSSRAGTTMDKFANTADAATEAVRTTQDRITKLSTQLDDRIVQLAKALDSVNSITAKIDSGSGTMGQLLNDGRLYTNLLQSTKVLNDTIADVQRVVQQIEQEGIRLKLR